MSDEDIQKAESTGDVVTRPLQLERGQPRIVTSSRYIQDQRKDDLRMPNRLCTFDNMMLDDAVSNSVDVTNRDVLTALSGGEFVSPSGSQSSKLAADFLNYCIRNMSVGTWMEFVNNACTDLTYGWSFQNMVVERRNYGPYRNNLVLKKLAPRDQKSLYGWVWNKALTEIRGFVQKPRRERLREPRIKDLENGILISDIQQGLYDQRYPFVDVQQMLHFRFNPTNNNPQGNSPLIHCYQAWMEKLLVERYEIAGVSKDLAGALVLRVPSELIARANDPTNYPAEAREYMQLQKDAAALHAGESSYIVLTSDVDDVTKVKEYDMEFKGIEGGGKQYRTSEVIDQKRKSIYNVFGTSHLLLGQGNVGSNSLSSNQMTTHDMYVQRNIDWKVDVLNNQLAPRLLAVNNILLDYKDMPVFKAADPTKPSLDIIGKTIQRGLSVEGLSLEAMKSLYSAANWSLDGLEEMFEERKEMNTQSRAGESQGTSGTGNSREGNSSSDTNLENSLEPRNFMADDKTDRIIDMATDKCVNEGDLDKNGNYR